jgi:putative peptidoglycan lipid II flippase
MRKVSRLTRVSLLLAIFFGVDKLLGVLRTIIIGRQFGLSEELDVFNAANNLPDLLFALISGGALAIAFIPVLSEVLTKEGRDSSWKLFSAVANTAFIVTGGLAIIVFLLAGPLVRGELGIAPGFTPDQQDLAIQLMRLNLISTLIFSISGLVMAGLQTNEHFLLPAIAPLLYDVGQIFGAIILAPSEGYLIGGIQLPAFGLGIYGLVYGVIIGAALHLLIQVPGLIKYKFKWTPKINFKSESYQKVLRLMGPRLISMIFIQLIFLARDNLASRLPTTGSVTALSYGWWIQQVPETLIGTAIATALLPTLSEHFAKNDEKDFKNTIERALRVMIALSLPITIILSLVSLPLIQTAFGFELSDAQMIVYATQGYMVGLLGHTVVELGVRAFYARQKAWTPMAVSGVGFVSYLILAIILMKPLALRGIAFANSLSYSIQALGLILLLNHRLPEALKLKGTFFRSILSLILAGLVSWLVFSILPIPLSPLFRSVGAMILGVAVGAIPVWREIRLLLQL